MLSTVYLFIEMHFDEFTKSTGIIIACCFSYEKKKIFIRSLAAFFYLPLPNASNSGLAKEKTKEFD